MNAKVKINAVDEEKDLAQAPASLPAPGSGFMRFHAAKRIASSMCSCAFLILEEIKNSQTHIEDFSDPSKRLVRRVTLRRLVGPPAQRAASIWHSFATKHARSELVRCAAGGVC